MYNVASTGLWIDWIIINRSFTIILIEYIHGFYSKFLLYPIRWIRIKILKIHTE